MAEDLTLTADPSPAARETWWAAHRLRYNIGLLVGGSLGFIGYAIAVDRCINLHTPGDWEITLFTTAFQGVAYLAAVVLANLCYYLGPWSEGLLHPSNVAIYRKITFRLGFWFSVLLPFTPSALLFYFCSAHAGSDKKIIVELARPAFVVATYLFNHYK